MKPRQSGGADLHRPRRLRKVPMPMPRSLVHIVVASLLLSLNRLPAQEADGIVAVGETPLVAGAAERADAGQTLLREQAARRAMRMGFPTIAIGLFEQLIAATDDAARRDRLTLDLTMALLEDNQLEAAATLLAGQRERPTGQVRLRRALIAFARGNPTLAESELRGVQATSLPAEERAWFHYLVGSLADAGGEPQLARQAFRDAVAAASSGLQRARFELADLQSSWRVDEPTEAQARTLRRRVDDYAGEQIAYDAAKRYAAVLAGMDRQTEAASFLQNQLLALPGSRGENHDDFRLLLGLILGADSGLGRNALANLLADGVSREKQRIALRMLVNATSSPEQTDALREQINQLMAAGNHPIEQDLLLFRAQLASSADAATRDALTLLERFPASDLRPAALGILVSAAWEESRYRAAAGYAAQARRELPESFGEMRAQMAMLQAEAFFRGGDYRSAADVYATVWNEPPSGVNPGDLVFQEVLARILDQQLTAAANRIDLLANDPRFDVVNRWQSEWNLARALQAADRVAEAYARVNRLVAEGDTAGGGAALPVELAVRVAWLQARLALEAGEPSNTLERTPALRQRLAEVEPVLREEVESSLRLLEAEAQFALGRQADALASLQQLREQHASTDAAVYSYIAEANAQAVQGQLVEAQRLLTELVSRYPDNRYAPYALFQSALIAEGRREEVFLAEAIDKIEELVESYPDDDLVFYARFKQGDLLRKLNQWGPARQVYELIINRYPQHGDIWAAHMALADTMNAQAGTSDASLRDSAAAIYERLRDLPNAPVELRIEAGVKAGNALSQNGQVDRAVETWWQVAEEFLLGSERVVDVGTRGRYWLSRLLRQLGQAFEAQGRLADARRAYDLINERGLPQREWARAQSARLGRPDNPVPEDAR